VSQNTFQLTSAQEDASQRHNLHGVAYLLSGTLKARRAGLSDADFRWATQTFSGALGAYEAYLGPPQNFVRAMGYAPGDPSLTPQILIPIRNLPFRHSVSLVASLTDNDYAWEDSVATLRVGYVKPGQVASGLAAEDWRPLSLDGFFGAPQDITLDGFNIVLFPRGARRARVLRQPLVQPTNSVDLEDVGKAIPIPVGMPDTWFLVPTKSMGVRGFTISAHSAGDTTVRFRLITTSGHVPLMMSGVAPGELFAHYQKPTYVWDEEQTVYDPDTRELSLVLTSGLAADIPRGAFVQSTPAGVLIGNGWRWDFAAIAAIPDAFSMSGAVGWLLGDGTVKEIDISRWPIDSVTLASTLTSFGSTQLELLIGASGDRNCPTYFDPNGLSDVEVTQQPTFSTAGKERLSSKLNYPTGGTGTDNANARDGSEETAATLGVSDVITLTFNSAPSPFANDDTTNSVLHVIVQGNVDFTDSTGSIAFGSAVGTGGVTKQFRFTQASPRDYNATVRCVGAGGSGGSVAEVWWEHDLEVDITLDRDDDVVVGPAGASAPLGPVLQFARLVARVPTLSSNALLTSMRNAAGQIVTNGYRVSDTALGGAPFFKAMLPAAMAGLQGFLLGSPEGNSDKINDASYDTARDDLNAADIRLNFVLLDRLNSWAELESQLAAQSQCNMHYGPSGHEILFMKRVSGFEAEDVRQSFRFPGVPGANILRGAGPMMERTPLTEIINTVQVRWQPDLLPREFINVTSGQDAGAVAIHGLLERPEGPYEFWAVSPSPGHPTYNAALQVSGFVDFLVERHAFGRTRFSFETAWIAHGLDRGSIVRVAYPVANGAYRNVVCEVEEIRGSPINAERFTVTCRSVANPSLGFEPNIIWTDVFVAEGDIWTTRIENTFDTWDFYWNVP